MDQDTAIAARINALCQRSASARAVLTRQVGTLRQRANLPARLRESVATNSYAWFGGSLAAGLVAALVFRRKPAPRERKHRKSILGWLFSACFVAAKPLLKAWLAGELKSRLQPLLQRPAAPR